MKKGKSTQPKPLKMVGFTNHSAPVSPGNNRSQV